MIRDNTTQTVQKFLAAIKVPVTGKSVEKELQRHPYYSSLLSISDVLHAWNIPNVATHLEFDELSGLDLPYICNFHDGDFVVVHDLNDREVIVSSHLWNKDKLNIAEFRKSYAGTVLVAEADDKSGEPDYKKNRRLELADASRRVIPFLLPVVFVLYLALNNPGFFHLLTGRLVLSFIVKAVGLLVSVLLLVQSIDAKNPIIQKLCSNKGKGNDCNSLLSSNAAVVIKGLSWSEVGFFYFSATLLDLLLNIGNAQTIQFLAILNLLTLPYTFYSLFYQIKVAKQWCVLCCTIQCLLWLEFLAFLPSLSKVVLPSPHELGYFLMCLLFPAMIWLYIRPYLSDLNKLPSIERQLYAFKHNIELFNTLLVSQPQFDQPDESWSILIGAPQADNVITMVSNPYCQPCAKTHKMLEKLLAERPNIQARIIFNTTATGDDNTTKVSRLLMSINQKGDSSETQRALDNWYGQKHKDYDSWSSAHEATFEGVENEKLQKQNDWCDYIGLTGTPTILINGYRLPDLYQLTDLKYMLL